MKILILTNLFPTPWDPMRGAFNRQQFERLGQLHDVDVITAVDFRERLRGRVGTVQVSHLHTDHFVLAFLFLFRFGIGISFQLSTCNRTSQDTTYC